jgi:nitroreductase
MAERLLFCANGGPETGEGTELMRVSEAVASRHSVRAFLERPVPRATVERLLERARRTPSGGNLQPWRVYVLGGARLDAFRTRVAARQRDLPRGEEREYRIYPEELKEPYRSRRFQCGEDLYASIGVARDDKPARLRQFANNFDFFGAPLAMFFAVDRTMGPPQWSDMGMFIQTLMLLAREEGLHTCAQEAWAYWPRTVGEFLGMPPELMLFCGLALGHRDDEHPINRWRTSRAELDEFVEWHGI